MALNFYQRRVPVTLVVLLFSLAISSSIHYWLGSTAAVLLVLQLAVVVIALQFGTGFAYASAIIEAIVFNFLFTTPIFSLQMFHMDDVANLFVFIVVAFTTSQLAERFRQQQSELKRVQLSNSILFSVSHDLRTPLVTIIGTLTTLQEYMQKLSSKEKNDLLDSATLESHRLHQYIENLLQATKIQHGALRFNKTEESIVDVIQRSIARSSDVESRIKLNIEGTLPELIIGSSLIEQALFNVLDNALRYSPKDECVVVNMYKKYQEIIIDISDGGVGLTLEQSQHMFDFFYTNSNSGMTDSGGSGLGLAVAKGLITAHQGRIVSVQVEHGCLIRIFLPIAAVN